jgi:formylglycine-generating enzyme required for sulfatase activity
MAASPLVACPSPAIAAEAIPFSCETPQEMFASGDFDGDGKADVVIVDKESGKFRVGYGTAEGPFSWVDCRPSGVEGIAGCSIGKWFAPSLDALAFASPDANQLSLVDAASVTAPGKPVLVAFTAGLGPNSVVPVTASEPGKAGQPNLYVGSIYNSPDANVGSVLRNDGKEFPKLAEETLPGVPSRVNRLSLKTGQTEQFALLLRGDAGDTFRVENLSGGKPVSVLTVANLPSGSDYAVGNFRGSALSELLFYKPGQNSLTVRPVEEAAGGQYSLGKGDAFDLGQAVRRVVVLNQSAGQRLVVVFGEGEKAGLFKFDGLHAPVSVQTLTATNELFTWAVPMPHGFVLFSRPPAPSPQSQPSGPGATEVETKPGAPRMEQKPIEFSTKYQAYRLAGDTCSAVAFGSLPSLADNDNIAIPDIYARIAADQKETSESEMKLYTNSIPGTQVKYVMVPIPGGEFMMGSPDNEPGHKPDEGPQHKVKILPFWMGRCEVTWNEYELFMYPDEEHRMRAMAPTDEAGDKLADVVTHPSKPYVEMSFGMGKDGYPAISMTHHAANKYCQWLSAKTGQFYRLPTEAEWEYACRAGTTTAYSFGSDSNKLGDYAWYEQNSDFKYQKVGKKKPNPWGLYDMYGNVTEWVLDQYDPDYYKQCAGTSPVLEPWDKATKPYPHAVKGGSWDDDATMCRSAARRGSERTWKMTDPQLPKSIWYLSDAQWVGFRIIRPLKVPPAEQMQKYWTSGTERD